MQNSIHIIDICILTDMLLDDPLDICFLHNLRNKDIIVHK